ncbi:MAG: NAD(P)H-binding protein, partial [Myxococcota bacterium]|nr:NAD(P)H-binding protein [Myxococcota bacterium]
MHLQGERSEAPQIALIGGSGRTGSALARLLAGADRRFRVLTRDPERTRRMLGSHAEPVSANVWDPFSIEAALTGVERVFLHGIDPSLEPHAIAAAHRAGVRRIVMGSALGPDALGPDALGADALGAGGGAAPEHQDAEDALRASGIAWTLLRPTAYMQSLAELVEWTMRGDAIRLPLGDAAVSWVDCRDVAAVAMHALLDAGHEGCTYVVSGPRALTGCDVAETLAHALGRPLRY